VSTLFNLVRGMAHLSKEQTLLVKGEGYARVATFIYI